MVLYGMDSTQGVELDMIINHAACGDARLIKACVIIDMPFGSYEDSPEQALKNAKQIMDETGANGVKLRAARRWPLM